MSNLFINLINILTAGRSPVVSHAQTLISAGAFKFLNFIFSFISNLFKRALDIIISMLWSIEKFVLAILEALEFIGKSLLGVGTTLKDYSSFAKANNLTETFVKTFRAMIGVAIVLMIIFTCIAMVKQEWDNISNEKGPRADQNKKGPIIRKFFRGLIAIIALPISMILIIAGINSVLTSFATALNGGKTTTVAANILSVSSYDANKYRRYANADKRVPIVIQAYKADNYGPDEQSKLYKEITSTNIQNKLSNINNNLRNVGNSSFLSFNESLTYSNNTLTNSQEYGDCFESFVCTSEQYQIMAEFIDYAQLSQQEFYIRSVDDDYIEWKYVDTAIYDKDKKSLTINYKNASEMNINGSTNKNQTYSIVYSMGYDVSSPISNALETLKSLLGLGEYSDNTYNTMEREEDSVNVVKWENEKAALHFSRNFDENDASTWTATDQILMFEYYHFSENNDLSEYSISRLKYAEAITNGNPVTKDVYKLNYRVYYAETDSYSDEKTIYCTLLNGNYYVVEQSEEEMDEYGNYYYVLKTIKDDVKYDETAKEWYQDDIKFLASEYRAIYEYSNSTNNAYTYLRLSKDFDLNNPSNWTYTDQIIMYEYYKDLSYINNLSKYKVSDFQAQYDGDGNVPTNATKRGVKLSTYIISNLSTNDEKVTDSKKYAYLNGTYYEVEEKNNEYVLKSPADSSRKFITALKNNMYNSFYNYTMALKEADRYGISSIESEVNPDKLIISSATGDINSQYFNKQYYYYSDSSITTVEGEYTYNKSQLLQGSIDKSFQSYSSEKYDNFILKFSSNFDYTNVSTWTYRDYFILYLYAKYLSYSGSITIDQLMTDQGISGTLGRIGIEANTQNKVDETDTSESSYKVINAKFDADKKEVELTEEEKKSGVTKFEYLFKIDSRLSYYNNNGTNEGIVIYLKIDDIMNISEKNIINDLDVDQTFGVNDFDFTSDKDFLITTFNLSDSLAEYSKVETEYKTFEFSDSFLYTNMETWTMQDFLLLLLNNYKVNDSTVLNIKESLNSKYDDLTNVDLSSYKCYSLVYIFKDNDATDSSVTDMNGKKFYAFGSKDHRIYVNESYITSQDGLGFESFDEWLNSNVVDVLAKKLGYSASSLITDSDSLVSEIYNRNNLSKYVTSGYLTLLQNLVSKYVYNADDPIFNIYSEITSYKYQQREDFSVNDLSTWTKLDLIIYLYTGKIQKQPYLFKTVMDSSNNKYLVLNDKYAVSLDILNSNKIIDLSSTKTEENGNIIYQLNSSALGIPASSDINDIKQKQKLAYEEFKNSTGFTVTGSDDVILTNEFAKYNYAGFTNSDYSESYKYLDAFLTGLANDTNGYYKIVEQYYDGTSSDATELRLQIVTLKDKNQDIKYIVLGTTESGNLVLYRLENTAELKDSYNLISISTGAYNFTSTDQTEITGTSFYETMKYSSGFVLASRDNVGLINNAKYKFTYRADAAYSYLDAYLQGLMEDTDAQYKIQETYTVGSEYLFSIYKLLNANDDENYICLGTTREDNLVLYRLEENDSEPIIKRSSVSVLNLNYSSVFSKTPKVDENGNYYVVDENGNQIFENYSAFTNIYGERLKDGETGDEDTNNVYKPYYFSVLDAIIYYYANSTMINSNYNIYKFNDGTHTYKFLYVNGYIVEYTDELAKVIDQSNNLVKDEASDKQSYYVILLDRIYSKCLMKSYSNTASNLSGIYTSKVYVKFELNDPTTWTALNIILYKSGMISGSTDMDVDCKLTQKSDGSARYLMFSKSNGTQFYVNLKELASTTEEDSSYTGNVQTIITDGSAKDDLGYTSINLSNVSYRKIFYMAYLMKNFDDTNQLTASNLQNIYANSFIAGTFLTSNNKDIKSISDFDDIKVTNYNIGTSMDINDVTTWRWFEMLNYYLYNRTSNGNPYLRYYSNGGVFIDISQGDSVKNFVEIKGTNAEAKYYNRTFASTGNETITFDFSSDKISKIGLIFNRLTKSTSGTLTTYTFKYDESDNKKDIEFYSFTNGGNIYFLRGIGKNEEIQKGSDSSMSGTFSYRSEAGKTNLNSWTILDILIKKMYGNVDGKTYLGTIFKFNDTVYFSLDGYNYNLTVLEADYDTDTKIISCTKKFSEIIGFDGEVSNIDTSTKLAFSIATSNDLNDKLIQSNVKDISNDERFIKLYFSSGFNYSDISTWKLSDFILYYVFEKCVSDSTILNFGGSKMTTKNFQYYVNLGYVPATIFNVTITDKLTSDIKENRNGLVIGSHIDSIKDAEKENYICVDYSFIYELYRKPLYQTILNTNDDLRITLSIVGTSKDCSNDQSIKDFGIKFSTEATTGDFNYSNYYYFTTPKNDSGSTSVSDRLLKYFHNLKVTTNQIIEILRGNTKLSNDKYVNLRLSSNFNIKDPNTWTLLDYIIIRGYTDNVSKNMFDSLSFEDLKSNFFVYLYKDASNEYILKVNGNYYNLTKYVEQSSSAGEVIIDGSIKINPDGMTPIVSVANVLDDYDYSFKILDNTVIFNLTDRDSNLKTELNKDQNTFAYTTKTDIYKVTKTISGEETTYNQYVSAGSTAPSGGTLISSESVTYYMSLNQETYSNYRLSLTAYPNYTISNHVKKVNWPQKLINDMQTIYPDLNWSTLLATDGWLDTLGDYHSGTASGTYIATGNTANITAVGMVLSEFFLSVANEVDPVYNYSNYQYSSVFDEKTINALMLSIMGEENYNAVKMEAEVFVDLFNTGFASILEDVASERGINIVDGKVSNLTMSVYKSYLATAILSSDFGEYLYTVATRVYAQYTIYEYMAKASGNSELYYAYLNKLKDDNGETIDAFTYSSFIELLEYENKFLNDDADIPMFTFNINQVKKAYIEAGGSESKLQKEGNSTLIEWLKKYYKTIYVENAAKEEKVDSNDPLYCFMFDVLYSIKQNLKIRGISSTPTYLSLYENYIDGTISRWNYVKDASITGGSVYVQDYNKYKLKRTLYRGLSIAKYLNMYNTNQFSESVNYLKNYAETLGSVLTGNEEEAKENAKETLNSYLQMFNIEPRATTLRKTFAGTKFEDYMNEVLPTPTDFGQIWYNLELYSDSEKGTVSGAWETLNSYYEELSEMLDELNKVISLNVGEYTNEGSVKLSGVTYDDLYKSLESYYNELGQYISTQNIIDKVQKTSITFTLAQYSNNFVEDGFEFTIKNKQYSFKSTVSAQRLAEYVYGGEFLSQFGVKASYTNEDFEGMVKVSTGYDSSTGLGKKKLETFTTLRSFARNVADYTGKLYMITNLNDLSGNLDDSIGLTEDIYVENPIENTTDVLSKTYIKANLSYLILDYMVQNKYLPLDTLYSLIVAENNIDSVVDSASHLFSDNYIQKLRTSNWDVVSAGMTDEEVENQKIMALREYLLYVLTTTSNTVVKVTVTTRDPSEQLGEREEDGKKIVVTETQKIVTEYSTLTNSEDYGTYGYYSANGYTGTYSTRAVNSTEGVTAGDRTYTILKKVVTYITGYAEKGGEYDNSEYDGRLVDFTGMSYKDLKNLFIDAIIDYKQYENASGEENTQRYLSLFYLVSGEFNYFISNSNYKAASGTTEEEIGRLIKKVNKDVDPTSTIYQQAGAVCYKSFGDSSYLRVKFRVDSQTQSMILKMAGINNRPIEELVNLQYNDLYNKNGYYDEADGDTFILCTYDESEGLYYPVLATGNGYKRTTQYNNFLSEKGEDTEESKACALTFSSDYIDSKYAYPVIARGLINASGLPTAIKMVNGDVYFYRTNITSSSTLNENSTKTANVSLEVTTINYTSYVDLATFKNNSLASEDSQTMYIGASTSILEFSADVDNNFVQYNVNYKYDSQNDMSGVGVLDNFSAFYNITISESSSFHFLLFIGFCAMIPVLFRVVLAAMQRILDLMFLILIGPIAIATNQTTYDDKPGKIYGSWKNKLSAALLSVFGLVVSFSIYYILVSTIMKMTFISAGDATMQIIENSSIFMAIRKWRIIGGLLEANGLNTLVRYAFILTSAGMIQSAATMISQYTTAGIVKNPFNSQLSDKDTLDNIKAQGKAAKDMVEVGKKLYTGELLMEALSASVEQAKQMIPGSAFISNIHEIVTDKKNKHTAKKMRKMAEKAGLSKGLAKKYSTDFYKNTQKIRKARKNEHMKKANAFMETMGKIGVGSGSFQDQTKGIWDKRAKKEEKADKKAKKKKEKLQKKFNKAAAKNSNKKGPKKK